MPFFAIIPKNIPKLEIIKISWFDCVLAKDSHYNLEQILTFAIASYLYLSFLPLSLPFSSSLHIICSLSFSEIWIHLSFH